MFRERLLYAPSISYPRPNQCQKQSCIFPLDDRFLVPWSSCGIKLSFHVPHQNLSVAGRTQKVPWWSKPNSAHAAAMAQKVLKTAFAVIHKFNKSVFCSNGNQVTFGWHIHEPRPLRQRSCTNNLLLWKTVKLDDSLHAITGVHNNIRVCRGELGQARREMAVVGLLKRLFLTVVACEIVANWYFADMDQRTGSGCLVGIIGILSYE